MALPEFEQPQPRQPEQAVQAIPEQAEIPAHVETASGIQATPAHPQPLQQGGEVLAQPVPAPQDSANMPTITVPAGSQEQLEKLSHGQAEDASTWFGVLWLYKIKQAFHKGMKAAFMPNNQQ